MSLDKTALDATLREFISGSVDYDIHKSLERDEQTGKDHYPELVLDFIYLYDKAQREGTK